MSTFSPVACLYPRGLCDEMQKTCTVIEFDGEGYRTSTEVLLDQLTVEERAEYERNEAEYAGYDAAYADYGPPALIFATIEHALDYARADRAMDDCGYDLHAFGAPSECYSVMRGFEERVNEAAMLAINWK